MHKIQNKDVLLVEVKEVVKIAPDGSKTTDKEEGEPGDEEVSFLS